MILEIDAGNSRVKWRHVDAATGAAGDIQVARDLNDLFGALEQAPIPAMARMCSVRGEEFNNTVADWIGARWSLILQVARVTRSCGGVSNQYQDLNRLGVDRWLAMLAAYQQCRQACIVIDSGTALTIDVLNDSGVHQGGYITPGLQLLRNSLELNTRIRLSPDPQPESLQLGHSTDSAVRHGTLALLVRLIDSVIRDVELAGTSPRIFFAGGDASTLAAQSMARDFQLAPTLVLDGLAIACPFAG